MFTIICVLPGSEFTGQTEEVERETDYSFERVVSIYGKAGIMIYPKTAWKRSEQIPVIEPSIDKYSGDTH